MKISITKFRHLLLTAIHSATKGKQTEDLEIVATQLETEASRLRMKISSRKTNNDQLRNI